MALSQHSEAADTTSDYRKSSNLLKREIARRADLQPGTKGYTDVDWPPNLGTCDCNKESNKYKLTVSDKKLIINVTYMDDAIDKKGRNVVDHENEHIKNSAQKWNGIVESVNKYDGKEYDKETCDANVKEIENIRKKAYDESITKNQEIDKESYDQ